MKRPVLFFISVLAVQAAGNIFISQNGGGTGASCTSSQSVAFFNTASNWGTGATQIGPGSTVTLCGTFNAPAGTSGYLTFQGSGTSGSPITLVASSGVLIQAPYFGSGGAISASGSYITINGAKLGTIQATANGTKLANQAPAGCNAASCTVGINIANCNNCTVQNWTVANIYVNVPPNDESAIAGGSAGIFWNGGNNVTISGNTVHDAKWCILYGYPPGVTSSNVTIANNIEYDCDHGVAVYSDDPGAALTTLAVYSNTIHDASNWDDTPPGGGSPSNHHDGIHISPVQSGATLANSQVFDNYIYGNWGTNCNAFIYSEADPGSGTITGMVIFNNLLVNTSTANTCANGLIQDYGGQNTVIANNTLVGSTTSAGTAMILEESSPYSSIVKNNIITGFQNAYYVAQGNALPASDYNDLANDANIAFVWGTSCCATLATWKTQAGSPDPHSITTAPNLSTTYVPQTGSPVINTGANLTSLGFKALDVDKSAVLRPASGAWTMGAYTVGGTPPPSLPVITSFAATPATLTASGTVTLSWAVTGATSLSISPTVGTVTGTSVSIPVSVTTTYILTATNSAGSVTSTVTVTVSPNPPPPTGVNCIGAITVVNGVVSGICQ